MSEFEQWFENSEWYGHLNINGARAVWQAAKQDDAKTIAELQAENEALRKDAERYRWLRHGDNDELVIQHGPVAPDYHWLPRNERLDDMIDAAISKGGE